MPSLTGDMVISDVAGELRKHYKRRFAYIYPIQWIKEICVSLNAVYVSPLLQVLDKTSSR